MALFTNLLMANTPTWHMLACLSFVSLCSPPPPLSSVPHIPVDRPY